MPRKQASLGNTSPQGTPARARKTVKRVRMTAHEPAAAAGAVTGQQPNVTRTSASREDIAMLAYSYWEARGCQGGCAEDDWVRAERELLGLARRS
jgi:hypothetical protein